MVGVNTRYIAQVKEKFALGWNDVFAITPADDIGRQGRIRHAQTFHLQAVALFVPCHVLDEGDDPRRVFDGVDAPWGQRRVRGSAMHPAAVSLAALVRSDHLHVCRLADHAAIGPDTREG